MFTNFSVEWARNQVSESMRRLSLGFQAKGHTHWSRVFEYPWVMENSDLRVGQLVLDAAGGDGPIQSEAVARGCHVTNVDIDPMRFPPIPDPKVLRMVGDIRDMKFFPDGVFHRVLCVSVLEHVEDPVRAVRELWRVLAPGGRLVVTMDVASYARWNHTIDVAMAQLILRFFNVAGVLPPAPADVLTQRFPEWEPKPGDQPHVDLRVLCFRCDKT